MNESIFAEKCKMTFGQLIDRDGMLVYKSVGVSMLPLIRQGKDLIIVEKPVRRLKKWDIALYRRDSGQYVLHRVIAVKKNGYLFCGDNQFRVEKGIKDEQILGIMTGMVRGGKDISIAKPSMTYRIYLFVWCSLFPARIFVLHSVWMLHRIKSRICRKCRKVL